MTFAKHVEREFLLAFWKLHILHHAEREPVFGRGVIRNLRRHGYRISPATLYPLLARMVERGWLGCECDPDGGLRARRDYTLTSDGRAVLGELRKQIVELHREVVLGEDGEEKPTPAVSPRRVASRASRMGRD